MYAIRSYYALRARKRAFHPAGSQRVLHLDPRVFAVLRLAPEDGESGAFVLALTNTSNQSFRLEIPTVITSYSIHYTKLYDALTTTYSVPNRRE